jgi:hypothetical protein
VFYKNNVNVILLGTFLVLHHRRNRVGGYKFELSSPPLPRRLAVYIAVGVPIPSGTDRRHVFSKIIKTPELFFMFPPRGLQLRQRHGENNRATSGESRKGEATQPRPNPKLQPPIPESISARFVNSRPNPSSPSSSLPFGAPYRGSIRDLVRIFGYGDVGSWCV